MVDSERRISTQLSGRSTWHRARRPELPGEAPVPPVEPARPAAPAPPPPKARGAAPSYPDDEVLREGEVLADRYRIDRLIGSGGMGVVAAATHVTLGSKVAIKILRPEFASLPNAQGRFLREARAAARLRSEHVARVYDVGEREDGTPFMVMEYLEGLDLDAYLLTSGPMPVGVAAALVLQACEALAEAHELGFIHRDLKPSNLFLTQRVGGELCLKLLDFGVSKELSPDPTLSPDGARTTRRAVVGSPFYMAPEQALGSRGVDARCDLWALGVILFEALSGRRPFEGVTFAEIATSLANREPPWALLPASVPREVRRVLEQCLAKDPEERIPSAFALAEVLSPFAKDERVSPLERVRRAALKAVRRSDPNDETMVEPPPAPRPSAGAAPRRPVRRRRWLWLSAGASLALLPFFAFWTPAPGAPEAAPPPEPARAPAALEPARAPAALEPAPSPSPPPPERLAPPEPQPSGEGHPVITFASERGAPPSVALAAAKPRAARVEPRAPSARPADLGAPRAPAAAAPRANEPRPAPGAVKATVAPERDARVFEDRF
ncbi:MAG TPA: serine/threonine-protein kinase [Polyangiaceae bacterium]|nr:serine/threonine-protein kinase [Polyangiaceae bacterium]